MAEVIRNGLHVGLNGRAFSITDELNLALNAPDQLAVVEEIRGDPPGYYLVPDGPKGSTVIGDRGKAQQVYARLFIQSLWKRIPKQPVKFDIKVFTLGDDKWGVAEGTPIGLLTYTDIEDHLKRNIMTNSLVKGREREELIQYGKTAMFYRMVQAFNFAESSFVWKGSELTVIVIFKAPELRRAIDEDRFPFVKVELPTD